ncbi:hypothetical protein M427DRAFT_37550 [Gonapodya prolifera JEL478]|uniref:Aminoglycoside phosphotransferase domain-containing protein n=1 Tax=Gonapodya prolifera (strain JEL478) TaxID=1344416 RepID=A0A139A0G8_GONPJ|nr:hypothetical protein M427DRAFT_37550 [Gonapodya prolifera JEL478]|eukprot:KXS10277.1 hypothetical protein M427DRAFT_37550 [Gonapodya prolifera JEL478]
MPSFPALVVFLLTAIVRATLGFLVHVPWRFAKRAYQAVASRTRGPKVNISDITVTPDFLERVLSRTPCLKGQPQISSFIVEPLLGTWNGVTSDLFRIKLTYVGDSDSLEPALPKTLVCKSSKTATFAQRIATGFGGVGATEASFYENAFRSGALDGWGEGLVRVPKIYSTNVTLISGETTLLMEDLSGFYRITSAVLADAAPIFTALSSTGWSPVRKKGHSIMMDPQRDIQTGDTIVRLMPQLLRYLSNGPRTLLHGDAHSGNLFFTKPIDVPDSVSDLETRMICVDWQTATTGNPFSDVAYCISMAQMESSGFVTMAKFYAERLETHVQKLRGDAVARALLDWIPNEEAVLFQFRIAFAAAARNVLSAAAFLRDWQNIHVARTAVEPGVLVFDNCLKLDLETGAEEALPGNASKSNKRDNKYKVIKYLAILLRALGELEVLGALNTFESKMGVCP